MKALLFSLLIHAALFLFLLLWRPAPYVEQKESHQKEIAFSLVSEPNHTVSVIRKDQADNHSKNINYIK